MTPKFRRLVAELIEGTQVQRSMSMLGTAEKPWDELIQLLHLFGWHSAEEIEKAIEKYEAQVEELTK